jgi:uncharacterized membrane protein
MNSSDRILLENLLHRLESLRLRQDTIQSELDAVESQIKQMLSASETVSENLVATHTPPILEIRVEEIRELEPAPIVPQQSTEPVTTFTSRPRKTIPKEDNLEKFIGENLISKIGIAITIIGVAFGAKYAIDHGILGPEFRILLGYILGGVLLFLSFRLKEKYTGYSAVLNGGAAAVFYLVTFFAYSAYGFLPQALAFVMMVAITAGTVYSAMRYDSQVLAQIGLVGAYSVPFLLSDNSGRVVILFSYVALINVGILVVAVLKSWRVLFYSSFVITWLMFGGWNLFGKESHQNGIALFFLYVFTLIFWITFHAGAWRRSEKPSVMNIIAIGLLMFLFFTNGMEIYHAIPNGRKLFLPINVLLPGLTYLAFLKYKEEKGRWLIVHFVAFTLFAIGTCQVWLNDQWFTMSMSLLAMVYMYAGRKHDGRYFELFSYFIYAFSMLSLFADWHQSNSYFTHDVVIRNAPSFFNLTALTSLVAISSALFSYLFITNSSELVNEPKDKFFIGLRKFWMIFVVVLIYFGFRTEIAHVWVHRYHMLENIYLPFAPDTRPGLSIFRKLENLSLIAYSIVFLFLLLAANVRWFKSLFIRKLFLVGTLICMLVFLTSGLYSLRFLRNQESALVLSNVATQVLLIRYVMIGLIVALIVKAWFVVKNSAFKPVVFTAFDGLMHVALIWILSSELIRILESFHSAQVYKLGLTILWGSYALMLVVIGIAFRRRHLRIMGMVFFGINLVKLMLYDLGHLSTIAKAGLFVLIGAFMLLVSYLYLRFRKKIFGDDEGDMKG